MGHQSWRRRIAAFVCAVGVGAGLALVGVGPANALVDPNQPGYQEPQFNPAIGGQTATHVYALESHNSADYVIDVSGGQTGNGATLFTWQQGLDSSTSVPAPQRNQSWEFVPRADNAGGKITTGYGALRDRNSGRCLDVLGGNDAVNNGAVSIWDCHGGENQQWTAVSNGAGDYFLKTPQFGNGKSFYLTRSPGGPCVLGQGNTIGATTEPVASCSGWKVQRMSYFFATNKVNVARSSSLGYDRATYSCLPGHVFRTKNALPLFDSKISGLIENPAGMSNMDSRFFSDGVGYANPNVYAEEPAWVDGPTNFAGMKYWNPDPYTITAQVFLFCDPV